MEAPIQVPKTYAELPVEHIRISNHPANAPGVTPVQVVTLYRPDAHNAFTDQMHNDMVLAWSKFDADDRVKVIVVTGHGRMYCAGADLNVGFRRPKVNAVQHRDTGGRVALAIHRCRKPTIGALNGSAVGVGITMTLPMHIRVAYKDAKIGFVFARRGLVFEAASSYFLPRLIGTSKALALSTTGDVYPAHHRLVEGLFAELLDTPQEVLPRALKMADDIAQNCSTVSIALNRELLYRGADSAEGQHLLDSRVIGGLFGSADNNEGVQSFMEKRPAKFTGTLDNIAHPAYPWWSPIDTSRPSEVIQGDKAKL